jgi:hypothetical protein
VTAVRLELDFAGFDYQKWGGQQHAKRGDWLIDSGDDTYTVDAESFAQTYRAVGPGRYDKTGAVWAEQAQSPGTITTREGATTYRAGDYIVSNNPDGDDGYAVSRDSFESMYELANDSGS